MIFNIYKRKKACIDLELKNYRQEKLNEMEAEFATKRAKLNQQLNNLAQTCGQETAQYEHTYHHNKEEKGILLANLTNKIINAEEKLDYFTELLKIKEDALKKIEASPLAIDERERLYGIIDKLLLKIGMNKS